MEEKKETKQNQADVSKSHAVDMTENCMLPSRLPQSHNEPNST